ncbi:hypothetical protein TIFTF001_008288 [Ficus carica]|uniref:Glutathione S-transferase n=1 Tax=Ficus carica TaxID=3494 RepID=A0AA88D0E7_FICCA|nr:hypothetical protein TIFTF001_008288 [Ficus carica]
MIQGLQDKIKLVGIDLQDRPAWYKEKVYPANKVPALEHDGKVIGESLDLVKYVDSNFEGPSLFPDDPVKRKIGEELLSYVDTFTGAVRALFKSDPVKEAGAQFDYLENALKRFDDGPLFLGQLSLVDIAYIPFVERFEIFLSEMWKYDITAGRPLLEAWIEELNKIDAYKQTKIDPKQLVESYKARYLVQGLEDKIQLVQINLQNRPAWYKEKVYPPNKVPSLEHNGKVIGESLDLIKYVDSNFEGPSLFPDASLIESVHTRDPNKKKFGEELLLYVDTFTGNIYNSFDLDPIETPIPALVPHFDYLENSLQKFDDGPFFLGQISLVDIAYIPFVERFHPTLAGVWKYDVTEGRPKLAAWLEELNKIDAYKVTKSDEEKVVEYYKKRYLMQH